MDNHPLISSDPQVMTGMPCVRGTHVTVANILRQVADGRSPESICVDYPYLTHEAIRAALHFAADIATSEEHELLHA